MIGEKSVSATGIAVRTNTYVGVRDSALSRLASGRASPADTTTLTVLYIVCDVVSFQEVVELSSVLTRGAPPEGGGDDVVGLAVVVGLVDVEVVTGFVDVVVVIGFVDVLVVIGFVDVEVVVVVVFGAVAEPLRKV